VELEPEQVQLFYYMVEAARQAPREERGWYAFAVGGGTEILQGPGGQREVILSDVHELERLGLLRPVPRTDGGYLIPPEGYRRYAEMKREEGQPFERVEEQPQRFFEGQAFQEAFPRAYALWGEAEGLLWSAESDTDFTTIGHKAREAMQAFATELVERYRPPEVEPSPVLVNKRLGAVIAAFEPRLGERRAALLRALGDYSEATMGVIQRQEHGGQKEGQPLVWQDARRVVFHVAVVMFEFGLMLGEAPPEPDNAAVLEPG
jgi:hypothetical protein